MTTQLLIRLLLPLLLVLGAAFIAWARTQRPTTVPLVALPERLGWLDDDGLARGARWDGGPLGAL